MKISINHTPLSRQTLDAIARVSAIVGRDYPSLANSLETAMVQIGELAYQDAQIDAQQEPETFPNEYDWSDVKNILIQQSEGL